MCAVYGVMTTGDSVKESKGKASFIYCISRGSRRKNHAVDWFTKEHKRQETIKENACMTHVVLDSAMV